MSVTLPEVSRAPLTLPTEDELAFRDAVREFAEGVVGAALATGQGKGGGAERQGESEGHGR